VTDSELSPTGLTDAEAVLAELGLDDKPPPVGSDNCLPRQTTAASPLSGKVHKVEISKIKFGNRQRTNLDGAGEFAKRAQLRDSIQRRGLIHPIAVTRHVEKVESESYEYQLVVGGRRLSCCTELGWTHIPAQIAEECSKREQKAIELEENLYKADPPAADREEAILQIHELFEVDRPDWDQTDTAEYLGLQRSTISIILNNARAAREGKIPPEAKSGKQRRRIREAIDQQAKAGENEKIRGVLRDLGLDGDERPFDIETGNFLEWPPSYCGPKFHVAHVDLPYGADADNFGQSSMPVHGGYEDNPETARALREAFFKYQDRFLFNEAFLFWWFQTKQNADGTVYRMLQSAGWDVRPNPLIWDKSGAGMGGDIDNDPKHVYETCFFCSRGGAKIKQQVVDLTRHPVVSKRHPSEKPQAVLEHFLRMVVTKHTRLFDPTCGSGSSIRAARALGADRALGLELNDDFASRARLVLDEAMRRPSLEDLDL
jgi:ParB/RepB/Spo0J family partition protein